MVYIISRMRRSIAIRIDRMKDFATRLYWTDIEYFNNWNFYEQWKPYLFGDRVDKISRIKNDREKIRSVTAGALLSAVYFKVLREQGQESAIPRMSYGEHGKPYIEDCPFYFNLSHSGDRVICAVSTSPVGCDVEYKNSNPENIAKRFFTTDEYDFICSIEDNEERGAAFTSIWTLKESVVKASGKGLTISLKDFSLVKNGIFSDFVCINGESDIYFLKRYEDESIYKYACASLHNAFEESMRRIDISEELREIKLSLRRN